MNFYVNKENHSKYIPKPYDTTTNIRVKWQMDVKYIPKNRYSRSDGKNFINIL